MTEIRLSERYAIDITATPALIDKGAGIRFLCSHGTNGGWCDSCWNNFIEAGLNGISKTEQPTPESILQNGEVFVISIKDNEVTYITNIWGTLYLRKTRLEE